jgi:hypothetical protein
MARIGAAGGTVNGEDGASVVVPAGALKEQSTVTIAIAKSSAGAPVEPPSQGFLPVSNAFTITPHGHGFAEPVRVTLPFDASLVRDGDQLLILKAQPYGKWVAHSEVTREGATVTLAVREFSTFLVVLRPTIRITPAPNTPHRRPSRSRSRSAERRPTSRSPTPSAERAPTASRATVWRRCSWCTTTTATTTLSSAWPSIPPRARSCWR